MASDATLLCRIEQAINLNYLPYLSSISNEIDKHTDRGFLLGHILKLAAKLGNVSIIEHVLTNYAGVGYVHPYDIIMYNASDKIDVFNFMLSQYGKPEVPSISFEHVLLNMVGSCSVVRSVVQGILMKQLPHPRSGNRLDLSRLMRIARKKGLRDTESYIDSLITSGIATV